MDNQPKQQPIMPMLIKGKSIDGEVWVRMADAEHALIDMSRRRDIQRQEADAYRTRYEHLKDSMTWALNLLRKHIKK